MNAGGWGGYALISIFRSKALQPTLTVIPSKCQITHSCFEGSWCYKLLSPPSCCAAKRLWDFIRQIDAGGTDI